jgi:hypothetical protein
MNGAEARAGSYRQREQSEIIAIKDFYHQLRYARTSVRLRYDL